MSLASARLGLATALAVVPLCSRGAPAIDGEYDSPLGRIRISGDGTSFRGVLASPSVLCPFRPGEEVLQGTLLDDSLAGRLRVCLSGKGCAGEEWASALLLASRDRLSGAVHVAAKGCVGPFGRKGGVTLGRAGSSSPEPGAARRPVPPGPDDARARRERARSLIREGKSYLDEGSFERARARFLAAIEADPKVPEAYNGVGVTFRMRNALSDALAWYKKALSADPDFGDAYYNMACIYALQGKEEMALRYLKIAALNGYASGEGLDADPDLESLRQHPDYRALRARM
jgi:tetratricopeptide (TPR) repeat protein